MGYATFPDIHGADNDGIVCEADLFGTTSEYSKVHIHEVGHYLGLYHTFQEGCPNDDCLTSGDRVCDTPPDQATFTLVCYDGTNSCLTDEDDTSLNNPFRSVELGGLGDQEDEQDNYMDYSSLYCFTQFTAGQSERMLAALTSARSSLLDEDLCSTPCETPFTADATASAEGIELGENAEFSIDAPDATSFEWYVNGEQQGVISTFFFSPNTEGTYAIEGIALGDAPGCNQTFEFTLNVICGATAFFEPPGSYWPVGQTLQFEALESAQYIWTVNGDIQGGDQAFSYTFDEAGIFTIQLQVSNGICFDVFSYNVSIGNCSTGNEANIWLFQVDASADYHGLNFNLGAELLIEEDPGFPQPVGHNKSTFCDAAGNLQFICDGVAVYDANMQILENADGMITNSSAHWGSTFIRKPGSEHEIYLFTNGAVETGFEEGLRYHLIDETLNDGNGGIVEDEKNVLVDFTGMECATTVRHCNLVDFWLVYYDAENGVIKSVLVDQNGVSDTPVISDIELEVEGVFYAQPFKANGPGDMLLWRNKILGFDGSTGECTEITDLDVEFAFAYAWSMGGNYAYFQAGELEVGVYQADLTGPVEEWSSSIEQIYDGEVFDLGLGMSLGPDGKIYQEESFSGYLSIIDNPDLPAEEVIYQDNAVLLETVVNGFSHLHHSYIYGPSLFMEGDATACLGETKSYTVFRPDCIDSPIFWQVDGPGDASFTGPGELDLTFNDTGTVTLIASTEIFCGVLSDTLVVEVGSGNPIDLGPNVNICQGVNIILDAGEGYDSYEWQNGTEEQTFTVNQPGTYSVTATADGCTYEDQVQILGFIPPVIDLGPDLELCGDIAVLDAGSAFTDYVWQDGFTGPLYTAYEAGIYTVTASYPCEASGSVTITDCGDIINNISEQEQAINIFPNPSAGWVDIQLIGEAPIGSMKLVDASGRLVLSQQIQTTSTRLDLSELSDGVYLLWLPELNKREKILLTR